MLFHSQLRRWSNGGEDVRAIIHYSSCEEGDARHVVQMRAQGREVIVIFVNVVEDRERIPVLWVVGRSVLFAK